MTCEEVSNDGLRVIIQDGLFVACAEWSSDLDERILCRTTIGVLVVELFSKLLLVMNVLGGAMTSKQIRS